MYSQPWTKAEPRGLARYLTPDAIRHVTLPNAADYVARGDLSGLCEAVYDAARSLGIGYALEAYDPRAEVQQLRTPDELAGNPRLGTCLDLAAFFGGLCLGFDLLPYLVVTEDHALVMVSTGFTRRDWDSYNRKERELFRDGLLADADVIRRLVDDGGAIAVEVTGFARSDDPGLVGLNVEGRSAGGLPFTEALAAGRQQLNRPLQFALDVAELQFRWQFTPFAVVDPELQRQLTNQLSAQFGLSRREGSTLPAVWLRDRLAKLFARHTLFAGRDREIRMLDAFVADRSSGYAFVTARSGFGKSALLSNWIRSLESRGQHVCYHFISRTDGVADQDTTLRSLCQQLVHVHGLQGDLPNSTQQLRSLYQALLTLSAPDGAPLVVVVDGLDESVGWDPQLGPDMFPNTLGPGVHVVFSGREMAGRDYLQELELASDKVLLVTLTTFGSGEIAHLLRAIGPTGQALAGDPVFLAACLERSEGDPFYLHYLALDVREGRIATIGDMQKQPKGLSAHLDKWWDDVSRVAGEKAVSDLLSYLLVARGPLSRLDLTDIDTKDALTGLTFRRTLDLVRRYLVGGDEEGYTLCHPRFRDYVATQIGETERRDYRDALVAYCRRWSEHGSRYAFRFLPGHLHDIGARDELMGLFTPEWIAATWRSSKTYAPIVDAVGFALQSALEEPPLFDLVPGLALGRQTARELMQGVPADLLSAWVAMGQTERAVELVGALDDARGHAAELALAVTQALRHGKPTADETATAGSLALRAARLLPQHRSTSSVLETLGRLRPLLVAGRGLDESWREQVIRAVEAFADGRSSEVQVIALGMAAEAWASGRDEGDDARRLVSRARAVLPRIESGIDRLVAASFILPAQSKTEPEGVSQTVNALLAAIQDPFSNASVSSEPWQVVFENWTPITSQDQLSGGILATLEERILARKPLEGRQAGAIARAHARFGWPDRALAMVERILQNPSDEGALAVAAALPLDGVPRATSIQLLKRAADIADPANGVVRQDTQRVTGAIARAAAQLNMWDLALSTLGRLKPGDRHAPLRECLSVAIDAQLSGDALTKFTDDVLAATSDMETDDKLAIIGRLAALHAYARSPRSQGLAAQCASLVLSRLPEGNPDHLWSMVAVAEGEAGRMAEACQTLAHCTWTQNVGETLAVLARLAADQPGDAKLVAEAMLRMLNGDRSHLYEDGLIAAVDGLGPICEADAAAAKQVLDAAWQALSQIGSLWMLSRCGSAVVKQAATLDPGQTLERMEILLQFFENAKATGKSVSTSDFEPLIDAAAALASSHRQWAFDVERRFEALQDPDPSSFTASLPRLIAMTDPERAVALIRKRMKRIPELELSDRIASFKRLLAELTGERYSPREEKVRALGHTAAALNAVAPFAPAMSALVIDELLVLCAQGLDGDDLVEALLQVVRSLGADTAPLLAGAKDSLLAAADALVEPPTGADRVRGALAKALASKQYFDAAHAVVEAMSPGDDRDQAAVDVDGYQKVAEHGPVSSLETFFLDGRNPELKRAALVLLREQETSELLRAAATSLIDRASSVDRTTVMDTFAPVMLLPAHASGGPALMSRIVEGLEAWDRRFLDAARLIGDSDA